MRDMGDTAGHEKGWNVADEHGWKSMKFDESW